MVPCHRIGWGKKVENAFITNQHFFILSQENFSPVPAQVLVTGSGVLLGEKMSP